MRTSARKHAEKLFMMTHEKSGNALDAAVKDFVSLLVERHELTRVCEIERAFGRLWRQVYGVSMVFATVSHAGVVERMTSTLEKKFPDAMVAVNVDSSILGGAVIQIDDRRVDGSLRGRLEELEKFLGAGVVPL